MYTIHIEGFAKDINLAGKLADYHYINLFNSGDFPYGEDGTESKPNIFFRFYDCDKECSLDEAVKGHLRKLFGDMSACGSCYGYSEVTIEGFNISTLTMGGHNLDELIKSQGDKYLHILIDNVK